MSDEPEQTGMLIRYPLNPGTKIGKPDALNTLSIKALMLLLMVSLLSSCSTRQLSDTVPGSTAQRLVTYSLEKFVRNLTKQTELHPLTDKKVALKVHFLKDHSLLDYATQLLRHHLERRFQVEFAEAGEPAQYEVDVFFNSIGTDHDSFGLSLPSFGLVAAANSRIDILSFDMFHGVTEGYALLKNTESSVTDRTQRLLARVRADNVTTPIVEFPINQLD